MCHQLGYVPTGSLSKYGLFGLSYANYFSANHGWEVVNARKDKDLDISRVGVIAESESSIYAIRLASENPNYRTVILRNPSLVFDKQKFSLIKAKFLLVLATKKYEAERLEQFKTQLKKAQIQFVLVNSDSNDRFYDLSQAKRYVASDAETYKTSFYEFIK